MRTCAPCWRPSSRSASTIVGTAADTDEAIALAAEHRPDIALVKGLPAEELTALPHESVRARAQLPDAR